jgi:hypothetical protein
LFISFRSYALKTDLRKTKRKGAGCKISGYIFQIMGIFLSISSLYYFFLSQFLYSFRLAEFRSPELKVSVL